MFPQPVWARAEVAVKPTDILAMQLMPGLVLGFIRIAQRMMEGIMPTKLTLRLLIGSAFIAQPMVHVSTRLGVVLRLTLIIKGKHVYETATGHGTKEPIMVKSTLSNQP